MPATSREELIRRYSSAINHLNNTGAHLYEIQLTYQQAENQEQTQYLEQRSIIDDILPVLANIIEAIEYLRTL